jgi:hypothetical protein
MTATNPAFMAAPRLATLCAAGRDGQSAHYLHRSGKLPRDVAVDRCDSDFSATSIKVGIEFLGIQQFVKSRVAAIEHMPRFARAYDKLRVISSVGIHIASHPNGVRC